MQLQESPTAAFHTDSIHLLVTAYKFVVCRGTAELVKDFLLLHILCKLLINSYMTLISAEAHASSSRHQDRAGKNLTHKILL